jgi:ribonuclease III
MSRRRTGKRASIEAPNEAAVGAPTDPIVASEHASRPAPSESKLASSEARLAPSETKPAPSATKPARGEGKPAPGESKSAARASRSAPRESKPVSGQKRGRRRSTADFEASIGYRFDDPALLEQALTHISALTGVRNRAGSYQRLEFLGDHVLGLVISDMLFRAFAKADEGEMSRRLADLVRKEACADVARAISLGEAIRLGASEANAGGRSRTAILADVCEALIGAVFVDGGYPAASALIERLWSERMRRPARPLRDSKTVLQEWAQARGLPTPAYREVERKGPDHDPEFRITVELPHLAPAEGLGRSKRAAEQAAAAAMLTRAGVKADRLDG